MIEIDRARAPVPEESDTEQVTKSFGILKVDNNKYYYISDAHWASVLHEVCPRLSFLLRFTDSWIRYPKFVITSLRTKNSTRNRQRS